MWFIYNLLRSENTESSLNLYGEKSLAVAKFFVMQSKIVDNKTRN